MSKASYGFRAGRLPLRTKGIPWAPLILALLAAGAWIWALAPREEAAGNLSPTSIAQSASPVKGENPTPAPEVKTTLATDAVTLYAVQISAHGDEASALAAQEAAKTQGLLCTIYRQGESYKLLDRLCPTQEAADARKAELQGMGREAYVFTWEIPAMQAEIEADEEATEVWRQGLTLLTDAAKSPRWAGEESAEYTAKGLGDAMQACAQSLAAMEDAQAGVLAQTLAACAEAIGEGADPVTGADECAIAVSRYVADALSG